MEQVFRIIPVPLFSHTTEAGNIFGLAKFNLFELSRKDKVSKPSKLAGVVTFSSKKRINASFSTELISHQNRFIVLSAFNYNRTPENFDGIGNVYNADRLEQVTTNRFKFTCTGLIRLKKHFYGGGVIDVADYFDIKTEDSSFLVLNNINGVNGGTNVGVGISFAYDNRDNRYNGSKGAYVIINAIAYPGFLGSSYKYTRFNLDIRKYINPLLKHVIAIQATTTHTNNEVPFYNLALLGGDSQMRGYYQGILRDKILVDTQVEYRVPVWNIFGIATWLGTGRVADKYTALKLDGFKLSYGAGLRVKIDRKHNTNLRFDFGFGSGGEFHGSYINFAEAF